MSAKQKKSFSIETFFNSKDVFLEEQHTDLRCHADMICERTKATSLISTVAVAKLERRNFKVLNALRKELKSRLKSRLENREKTFLLCKVKGSLELKQWLRYFKEVRKRPALMKSARAY